jgi:hypothetical protein
MCPESPNCVILLIHQSIWCQHHMRWAHQTQVLPNRRNDSRHPHKSAPKTQHYDSFATPQDFLDLRGSVAFQHCLTWPTWTSQYTSLTTHDHGRPVTQDHICFMYYSLHANPYLRARLMKSLEPPQCSPPTFYIHPYHVHLASSQCIAMAYVIDTPANV